MASNPARSLVGFLGVYPAHNKHGYVGGLLVTDGLGKPEEFRVTLPIRPTAVQTVLYGDSLLRHIGVNLCGIPLFTNLKRKDEVILLLVENYDWLHLAELLPCLVAHIETSNEEKGLTYLVDDITVKQNNKQQGMDNVIHVRYPTSYDSTRQRDCHKVVESLIEYIDLSEPFTRVAKALEVLSSENSQFS